MLITNATLITWEPENQILTDQAVYIDNDRIVEIGPIKELSSRYQDAEQIDAGHKLVMPGNICAHTHFYGAFSRGMTIPGDAPKDFPEILEKLWWPLDKSLTEDDIRYSALLCLADAIRHGTTTLIDHHASPNAIDGSLDIIAETVEQAGLRAVLCYEVTDRDGPQKMQAGINENLRFLRRLEKEPVHLLAGTFGLHASLTLSNTTLQKCRNAVPEGTGFHVHAAESPADEWDSLNKYGLRVIDRLKKFDLLGPKTITAHCVHVDTREINLLADSGAWVTHQPRSNMNNAVGVAQIESMMRAGVKVCLGNDGFSNAMWEEWKTAYLIHKVWNRDPRRMSGYDVVNMAVYNNAALANMFFPAAPIGRITPGAFADLVFVEYHAPTPLSPGNLPWHILFGFRDTMITTTIVGGKILMKDRQLTTLDTAEISARAHELATGTWQRYQSQF
ncbi:MAG: putative aminohydrolase SsnA [Anaerolineales bacterium]|nr:putative aminohydrolase SsnA [Anaerolineales bacterium]